MRLVWGALTRQGECWRTNADVVRTHAYISHCRSLTLHSHASLSSVLLPARPRPHIQINDLRSSFEVIDHEKNGYITATELQDVMKASSMKTTDVERIFRGIDQDQSGQVDYVEFLAAAMEQRTYVDEEKMQEAFETFDQEGSGFITHENLMEIMGGDFEASTVRPRALGCT